jgi:hypothetical protein
VCATTPWSPPPPPAPPDVFISEVSIGVGGEKYLEIFNPGCDAVSADDLALAKTYLGPDTAGAHDFFITLAEQGLPSVIPARGVLTICSSAYAAAHSGCDATFGYLSDGDDGQCLVRGTDASHEILDCVGDFNGAPEAGGWSVCGAVAATRETLVRKPAVESGNRGEWARSAGTSTADCEWLVRSAGDQADADAHTSSAACSAVDEPACVEGAGVTNKYNLNCAQVLAQGFCTFVEAGLWSGGGTNMGMCPETCDSPDCSTTPRTPPAPPLPPPPRPPPASPGKNPWWDLDDWKSKQASDDDDSSSSSGSGLAGWANNPVWFIVTIVVVAAAVSGIVTAIVLQRRWHARMRTVPTIEMVPTAALDSGTGRGLQPLVADQTPCAQGRALVQPDFPTTHTRAPPALGSDPCQKFSCAA